MSDLQNHKVEKVKVKVENNRNNNNKVEKRNKNNNKKSRKNKRRRNLHIGQLLPLKIPNSICLNSRVNMLIVMGNMVQLWIGSGKTTTQIATLSGIVVTILLKENVKTSL